MRGNPHFWPPDERCRLTTSPRLGMRLMRGRLLANQDESGASHAVVINQSMAERLWPHQDPLGRHLLDVRMSRRRGCGMATRLLWWWAL